MRDVVSRRAPSPTRRCRLVWVPSLSEVRAVHHGLQHVVRILRPLLPLAAHLLLVVVARALAGLILR